MQERRKNYSMSTITKEQISDILTKYDIGKSPLSLLLGWGEKTLTRYCDGKSEPSKSYVEMLQRISDEPDYYLSLLESNKDKISSVAYKKSQEAAQELLKNKMQDAEYSEVVITGIANDVISKLNAFNLSRQQLNSIVSMIDSGV
jgi:predicted transcriptional regulator